MSRLKFLFVVFGIFPLLVHSQIKALTEEGKEVILYNNGTWKFIDRDSKSVNEIQTNKTIYTKKSNQSFLVRSKIIDIGVHINPQEWIFNSEAGSSAKEYGFTTKDQTAFAFLITEKLDVELSDLRQVALFNAKKAGPDLVETYADYRMVNGRKLLCLKFECTVQNIPFSYMGYYYAENGGTAQLIVGTTQKQFKQMEPKIEDFLNGLVQIKK